MREFIHLSRFWQNFPSWASFLLVSCLCLLADYAMHHKKITSIIAIFMNGVLPGRNEGTLGNVLVVCKEGSTNIFYLCLIININMKAYFIMSLFIFGQEASTYDN